MSRIDKFIEQCFDGVRRDPRYRPIIDRAKQAAVQPGATSDQVLAAAVNAARDQFQPQGADAVRMAALNAAMAARIEKPFGLADLPAGADKTEHFLVSALISLGATRAIDTVLPRSWAAWAGEQVSRGVGVLKEIVDLVTHADFSKQDIVADFKGAAIAPRLPVQPRFEVKP